MSSCGRRMQACEFPLWWTDLPGGGKGSNLQLAQARLLLQRSTLRLTPLQRPPCNAGMQLQGLGSVVGCGGGAQKHTTYPSQLVPDAALVAVGVQPGEDGPLPCAGGLVQHKAGGQQHVV